MSAEAARANPRGHAGDPPSPRNEILVGDCREILRRFPDDRFASCVTSPPYWGLRDYGIAGQIGAEPKLGDYLEKLLDVFVEVKRVLKDDGTLWLNIGDAYTSGNRTWRASDRKNPARAMSYRPPTPDGLKAKDLIGIPWRLAFKLQDAGWHLRADIVWHKPNSQPESVKDRPTRAHEYLFMFSKNERYRYNYDEMMERVAGGMRNRRSVWSIPTEAFPGAHFATFPPALVRPCLRASSRAGDVVLDPFLGSGTVGAVAAELGRSFVGIELKPEYAEIARRRIAAAG